MLAVAATLVLSAAGCSRESHGLDADQSREAPGQEASHAFGAIDEARLANAASDPDNWLTLGRDVAGSYYSPLSAINRDNVDRLGFAWDYKLGTSRGLEASPIVVDGVMYTSGNWGRVYAVRADTGEELWTFIPEVDGQYARKACCDVVNRGVAVWKGRVYVGTLDGHLYALDAASGEVLWRADTFENRSRAYTLTSAPQVAGDVVVIGNSGADLGARGYITAYDLKSGKQKWRFYTVPRDPKLGRQDHPDLEAAVKTWDPKSLWEFGGGGTVWDSMLYDPELNLLYVGTGNASPYSFTDRSPSGGDNLYLASILAINPDTGRLAWHYQTVPGENWDYTATMKMVLADLEIGGARRKVLMQAPKNGFFYVLDRKTGELLSAENFVSMNWASGVDMKTGKPVLTGLANYDDGPKVVFPSAIGARSWRSMSYNPDTGLVYIPAIESAFVFMNLMKDREHNIPESWENVLALSLDLYDPAEIKKLYGVDAPPLETLIGDQDVPDSEGFLKAWDPVAQKLVWELKSFDYTDGGVTTTAGGLIIQGSVSGELNIFDARTGKKLKSIQTGSSIMASPVVYAVDGVEYIAVMAGLGGADGWSFPERSAAFKYGNAGRIIAFRLDGPPPPLPPEKSEEKLPEPPARIGAAGDVLEGEKLFNKQCYACHSNENHSLLPNLLRLDPVKHEYFKNIVLEGMLKVNGMPQFSDALSPAQADQIHAYLISKSWEAYERQQSETAQRPN